MTDDIAELMAKVERLLAMLQPLVQQGNESAELFADDVRRQLAGLRKAIESGDTDRLRHILLDIVPNAKDLDAIDFRSDLHPDIDALSGDIEAGGARIAKPLIDAL